MMGLSVLGVGTVSALGSGIQTLRDGLLAKIKPNIEMKNISLKDTTRELPVYLPVAEGLERFIPQIIEFSKIQCD